VVRPDQGVHQEARLPAVRGFTVIVGAGGLGRQRAGGVVSQLQCLDELGHRGGGAVGGDLHSPHDGAQIQIQIQVLVVAQPTLLLQRADVVAGQAEDLRKVAGSGNQAGQDRRDVCWAVDALS